MLEIHIKNAPFKSAQVFQRHLIRGCDIRSSDVGINDWSILNSV